MLYSNTTGSEKNPFRSFWMAGYECTDQQNAFGLRVDFLTLTGHLDRLEQDYADLGPFNIQTVREGIRWSQVEKRAYHYDWSVVSDMIDTGRAMGIQQIWDLCHFGYPDDLTPLHPMFARRFAALCRAFVDFYRTKDPDGTLIVTPINEVGFMAWLGGEVRGTSPYCVGQGWEVKYSLMRAYIEGVAAMREADPGIRFLSTEPLVNVVPTLNASDMQVREALIEHEYQYQAMDMLAGRMCPELGGKPEYIDMLGLNYYYDNQWDAKHHTILPWTNLPPDPRWRPLRQLLLEAYNRYKRPVVISETSHPGIDRPHWIRFVAEECAAAVRLGIPLWGVCLYPIIDRPDWDHLTPWHQSGLWDAELSAEDPLRRVLYRPYAQALLEAQALLAPKESALL